MKPLPRPPRHLSERLVASVLEGGLSARRANIVDRHLDACASCRAQVAETEGRSAAARARLAARMAAASAEWDRSWKFQFARQLGTAPRVALAAAATVCAIVAGSLLMQRVEPAGSDAFFATTEALPIPSVTPGAVKAIGRAELCDGRSAEPESIPAAVRLAVLQDYRMVNVPSDQYELDYLITPELGGAAARENLWPERYGSRVWNARVKDALEDLLPQLVCAGRLDLTTAQHDIAVDWIAAYKKYFNADQPLPAHAARGDVDDRFIDAPRPVLISARLLTR